MVSLKSLLAGLTVLAATTALPFDWDWIEPPSDATYSYPDPMVGEASMPRGYGEVDING